MFQYRKESVLLEVKNFGISFGNKVILKDVNFTINDIQRQDNVQGQIVSLIGKSGIGKSQLLRALSGLHIKNAVLTGDILVRSQHVRAGMVGVVPQDYYIPAHLRLHEVLLLAASKNHLFNNDKKTISAAVDSYLTAFELGDLKDKFQIQLSGGQKQRSSIAMQLLNGSEYLLMDEPFSGLDPLMIDKTIDLLVNVMNNTKQKIIMIIVSHDLRNCIKISESVFILSNKGREPGTGATMIREIDLLERGLEWVPGVQYTDAFDETIKECKSLL